MVAIPKLILCDEQLMNLPACVIADAGTAQRVSGSCLAVADCIRMRCLGSD